MMFPSVTHATLTAYAGLSDLVIFIFHSFRLVTCDANLDVRDSVRELVVPVCAALQPGGLALITLKLGRRVGEAGVRRKELAVNQILLAAGFDEDSIRSVWLFSNSKNERTVIARKKR